MGFETEIGTCDFAATEAHAKTLSIPALEWTIQDALACAKIWDAECNETNALSAKNVKISGKYWDQVHVYSAELKARRAELASEAELEESLKALLGSPEADALGSLGSPPRDEDAFPMPDCTECGEATGGWTTCEITATSPLMCNDCEYAYRTGMESE